MPEKKVQTNPAKVMREKCLDCCCGQWSEVESCAIKQCPLWPWRMGKNPYRKPLTEAQKEARRRNAAKINMKECPE